MNYEDIKTGQCVRYTKWITPGKVVDFIALCGDSNSVHTKGERPIAHGMLVMAFVSTVIGKHLPGDGALWISSNIKFISPVHVWDKIVIIGAVHSKDDKNRTIKMFIDVFNENNDLCVSSTAVIKCTQ